MFVAYKLPCYQVLDDAAAAAVRCDVLIERAICAQKSSACFMVHTGHLQTNDNDTLA